MLETHILKYRDEDGAPVTEKLATLVNQIWDAGTDNLVDWDEALDSWQPGNRDTPHMGRDMLSMGITLVVEPGLGPGQAEVF